MKVILPKNRLDASSVVAYTIISTIDRNMDLEICMGEKDYDLAIGFEEGSATKIFNKYGTEFVNTLRNIKVDKKFLDEFYRISIKDIDSESNCCETNVKNIINNMIRDDLNVNCQYIQLDGVSRFVLKVLEIQIDFLIRSLDVPPS